MYFAYLCNSEKEYHELFHELEECGFELGSCGKGVDRTEDDAFRILCNRMMRNEYPFVIDDYTRGIPVLIGGYSNFLERVEVQRVGQTLNFSCVNNWYNIPKFDKSQYIWASTSKDFLEKLFSVRKTKHNSYQTYCDIKNGKDKDFFKNTSLSYYPIFRMNSFADYEKVKSRLKEHGFNFDYSDENLNKLEPGKRYFISHYLFSFYSMHFVDNDQLYYSQHHRDTCEIVPVDDIDYYVHSMLLHKSKYEEREKDNERWANLCRGL